VAIVKEADMSDRFTLEKFSQNPFYQEVNRRLVALAKPRPGQCVVDLGAGTGAVTRLLVAEMTASSEANGGESAEVIAVEPSESAIEVARRNLESFGDAVVRFVQGGAERLSQVVRKKVDAVFFCNAIHLVEEKAEVIQEVSRSLRKGGTFSFNTSFFQGAEPPESLQFYRRWMMKALRTLRREHGLSPDKEARALARQPLSRDEYVSLLEASGFHIRENQIVPVPMTLKGFEDISEYNLFIEGAMPGVPLKAGSEALKHGAREAFAELGLETSPRNWLLVVASKN
jgi:ubiquinone/menaquinone biosynthesis C-methylase UbiE